MAILNEYGRFIFYGLNAILAWYLLGNDNLFSLPLNNITLFVCVAGSVLIFHMMHQDMTMELKHRSIPPTPQVYPQPDYLQPTYTKPKESPFDLEEEGKF